LRLVGAPVSACLSEIRRGGALEEAGRIGDLRPRGVGGRVEVYSGVGNAIGVDRLSDPQGAVDRAQAGANVAGLFLGHEVEDADALVDDLGKGARLGA